MKTTLKLIALFAIQLIHTTNYAQSISQKQVLVYFKTGVQRNTPPNQNTVTISSSNITQVLNNYGLSASNVNTIPEVDSQVALYVNSDDHKDIADKMMLIHKDEKLRQQLIENGREQVKKYS